MQNINENYKIAKSKKFEGHIGAQGAQRGTRGTTGKANTRGPKMEKSAKGKTAQVAHKFQIFVPN